MARRVDANQAEIVDALRQAGASVTDLHEVGKGCPDIVVGWRDARTGAYVTTLMEIKTAQGTLTPEERDWWAAWQGMAHIVRSPQEALRVIGRSAVAIRSSERNVAQAGR